VQESCTSPRQPQQQRKRRDPAAAVGKGGSVREEKQNLDELWSVTLAAGGCEGTRNEEDDNGFALERSHHINSHSSFGTTLLNSRQLDERARGDSCTDFNHDDVNELTRFDKKV
jgi:hypothetical protein